MSSLCETTEAAFLFRSRTARALRIQVCPALSDRVAGGFGGVAPPGRSRPPERSVRELVHLPPRLLLQPMIMPALRARVTQARPAVRLIGHVVLEVALARGPAAHRA